MGIVPFFKKLIFSKEFNYSDGYFYLMMRVPGVILPMAGVVRLMNAFYSQSYRKARDKLFKIGLEQGLAAGTRYKVRLGASFQEYTTFVHEITEVLGLGRLFVTRNEKSIITIVINPSVFAEQYVKLYGKQKRPVCDYIRGLACGVFKPLCRSELEAVEVECKAMGDAKCRFVIKPYKTVKK